MAKMNTGGVTINLDQFVAEWICPECGDSIIHSYAAMVDVGNPICSACDSDVEMEVVGNTGCSIG
jgi:predicted RNA-binding Zn-ribbon protein involved in translation (DUF1610 family)